MLIDEDLVNDITLYLQELGNNITAQKLVQYLARPDIKEKHSITKSISTCTAQRYLHLLGYRFQHTPKGQFADGHERADVVYYRDHKYIPRLAELQEEMRAFVDGNPEYGPIMGLLVVSWFHDESIFYAHDLSAEFGWLRSLDERSARRVMRPGKNKDGYFTSDDILKQVDEAMDITEQGYPGMEHVFIYDNAPSHLKRADGAPSARHMPKFTPSEGKNWQVEVTKRTPDGKPVDTADGNLSTLVQPIPEPESLKAVGNAFWAI
ncbi:hypothetical protein FPV67DRAFT_1679827 [Lyophyllum atratum]|nr:hypothetical protein FPV67DRAFT_1679827 [Lyophyllum atratum]